MARTMTFTDRVTLRALFAVVGALTIAASSLVAAPTARADSAVTPLNSTITVTGKGWGHGIGMSQYGAYGAAVSGLSYQKIIAFYYPNTTLGSLSSGNKIRVWITADNDNRLHFLPASGLRIKDSAGATYTPPTGSSYTMWRISRSGSQRVLHYRNRSGTWVAKTPTGLTKTRVWYAENTQAGYVKVSMPGGKIRDLRGRVALRFSGSSAKVVNTLPMESYLRSVVPAEMPTSWHIQAVKAQVVAARSYAARTRDLASSTAIYDICDTTSCQVYKGLASRSGSTRTVNETSNGDAAVAATANKVVKWGTSIALTMFSSSNGGHSADGGKPYLVAKEDPYDGKMRNQAWSVSLSSARIQSAYSSIGTLKSVRVVNRDGDGPWGGRATSVTIAGTSSSVTVTGGSFKSKFGLKERLFLVTAGLKSGTGNYDRWKDLGGVTGWVGAPTASEKSISGGLHAPFRGADLFWSSAHGSHWVKGAIRSKYLDLGGATSALGFPTTDVVDARTTGASKATFTKGAIFQSSATGARYLTGAVYTEYMALGLDGSDLGLPKTDVKTTSTGTLADFVQGRISCPTGKDCVVSYG